MAILVHGTTQWRAEQIMARGPDPDFVEPGGGPKAENFSTYLESGPYTLKSPREYALGKARNFPAEGGPVILVMDVPDEIIDMTDLVLCPRRSGVVQFDRGFGIEELLAAWPTITKRIDPVENP
jgi:hypothetical protein